MNFTPLKNYQDYLTSWRIPGNDCMVVKDGKIHSQGTHMELLGKSELYSQMWQAHIGAKDGE